MGPGLRRSGLATQLKESGDGRDIDGESGGELTARAFAAINGGQDAFPEIIRQGFHESPQFNDLSSKWCAKRV
jgi:hypothetical protein